MTQKALGRSHRNGLTVMELLRMFPDDATSEKWFEDLRWANGRFCPDCGSTNTVAVASGKPMPYRYVDCRKHFSVRKGMVMQSSKLGLQKWAVAIYMMTAGVQGTSSMKLYREDGVRQATAWFLILRIREAFNEGASLPFPGPMEVDETCIGGKRRNMSNSKRKTLQDTGRGAVGKVAVVGAKDRATKRVTAYQDVLFDHETVKHSVSEYVRGMAHTNWVESFWSLLKRGYHGTFNRLSEKHLNRYIQEFACLNKIRDQDTIAQMTAMVRKIEGKRLRYKDLIVGNGETNKRVAV